MTVALWWYQYNAANVELIETGNLANEIHLAACKAAKMQADTHGLFIVGFQTADGFHFEDRWDEFHSKLYDEMRRHMPAKIAAGPKRTVATPWPVQGMTDVVDIPRHWPDWIGAPVP